MKKITFCLAVVLLLLTAASQAQQPAVQFNPAHPKPGEKITFTYNPAGTPMEGFREFTAYAYLIEGDNPVVQEIPLSSKGGRYTGTITTHDTTEALFVTFTQDKQYDNNQDNGYCVAMYSKEDAPAPGAMLALSKGFSYYGSLWGLKSDAQKVQELQKEEFSRYPASKEKYHSLYLSYLASSKDDDDKAALGKEVDLLLAKKPATEEDLSLAYSYASRALKDKEKAARADSLLKAAFPERAVIGRLNQTISGKAPLEEKISAFDTLQNMYPAKTARDSSTRGYMASMLATACAEKGDYDNMRKYLALITNKATLASALNSIAWKLGGDGITGEAVNAPLGKELSAQSLELLKEQMKDEKSKPSYYTAEQWHKQQENNYQTYADTYALLLYRNGDYQGAYEYEKAAVDSRKGKYADYNEPYAVYLEKVKGPEAAQKALEGFVEAGYYTGPMREQLKRLYLASGKTEADWNAYYAVFEQAQMAKLKVELAKVMINEPAPTFQLKGLDGKEISLASLKGKIVIVDFWATWCGPCKASFPGMKLAIEKYKNDPDVKFVFIDSWENGEKDKVKEAVAGFIEQNSYPFHVLMDYDNKVIESYKVTGIPTKFILDKDNQIRFKKVGFSSNTDAMVSEIEAMIEMSRGDGDSGKKTF